MTIECLQCTAANPEDKKYCGDCGAPLQSNPQVLRATFEANLQRRVETTVLEQFKDRKVVEIETAQAIATRLVDWAKLLGFIVGIPVALLLVFLGFIGLTTYADFTSKVELAQQKVQNAEKDLDDKSIALEAKYKKVENQLVEVSTLPDKVNNLTKKVDQVRALLPTIEKFPKSIPESDIKDFVQRRIEAGAIKSTHRTEGNEWVIETEWNVIGQQ